MQPLVFSRIDLKHISPPKKGSCYVTEVDFSSELTILAGSSKMTRTSVLDMLRYGF